MSPAALRIGDPVQVHAETEVLTVVCLDCGRAWVRDGAGNHLDYPEEDLVRARSKAYQETVTPASSISDRDRRFMEGWREQRVMQSRGRL